MSYETFEGLVRDLCVAIDIPDADNVLERGALEVEGFEVMLSNFDSDPDAMYMNFNFGIVTAGRTLRVFRLLLESNLTVYAQDQAQMGMHADTGTILLIVRIPMTEEIDGTWLAETITHYIEHGNYWKTNIVDATDEMFEGVCSGTYTWMKA